MVAAPDAVATPGWFEPMKWLATVFGTVMVMLVGFRIWMNRTDDELKKIATRVTNHENDIASRFIRVENEFSGSLSGLREDMEKRHDENKARQKLMDRRQMFTLKLVADVARKLGVDNRVDDIVITYLTSDDEDEKL